MKSRWLELFLVETAAALIYLSKSQTSPSSSRGGDHQNPVSAIALRNLTREKRPTDAVAWGVRLINGRLSAT
jgi:hypothetical protein